MAFDPSIPDAPRLATSEPAPKKATSEPAPKKAASEPAPKKAASEPAPKSRASQAPAGKASRSAVTSRDAPVRKIEPPAVALASAPASAPVPPPVKTAALVFDVSPWGEIYVDGTRHGTTPPVKTLDLPPGRYRIEVRNSARPPYLSYTTLEPGDVRRIRHQFE
jgi:hypothetical protein